MWNRPIIVLAVLFLKCLAVQNFRGKRESRQDANLLQVLSDNGLYNPLDPTGFIFEGNSKQYTGNGVDTPRFDPNNYAYKYAGVAFGSAVNPFVPSFMNAESINNSPNYKQSREPTSSLAGVQNRTDEIKTSNITNETKNAFLELPVASGSVPSSKVPEFLSQTFPDNIMSTLTLNASSMFPSLKFSGQPGMLGIGSQVPLQTVVPQNSPTLDHQYLPESLRNVSESLIPSLTYNQISEIGETKSQTSYQINHNSSSVSKPLYTGYPGMLGIGHMFQDIDSSGSEPKVEKDENSPKSYSNGETTNYLQAKAGVNANNWKGEWPGKTSVGGDWSGDWSEKWPKSGISNTDNKEGLAISNTTGSTNQQSQHINWGGSWPGSTRKETSTTKPNEIGNLSETMAALKKLMSILDKFPSSFDNSQNKAAQTSFSQMVSGWKDDMKS